MTLTLTPNDAERDVRKYLKARLKLLGGEIRKLNYQGRSKAPDELVLLPPRAGQLGTHFVAELKRPGKAPTEAQAREHAKLRAAGFRVEIIDSREKVDAVLFW